MNFEDRVTKEYVEGLLAEMPKLVIGTYTGNGTTADGGGVYTQTITLGFRPSVLLIVGIVDGSYSALCSNFVDNAALVLPDIPAIIPGMVTGAEITAAGFTVKGYYNAGAWMKPSLNDAGSTFIYLALR